MKGLTLTDFAGVFNKYPILSLDGVKGLEKQPVWHVDLNYLQLTPS